MTLAQQIFPPWPQFQAVNDTVRGGKSSSALLIAGHGAVVFEGHLDITALGGAGFASQSHSFPTSSPLSLPRKHFSGLRLTLLIPTTFAEKEPTVFLLSVKNDTPGRREDGRRESVTSFEWSFDVRELVGDSASTGTSEKGRKTVVIEADWSTFEATYRGRPLPKDDPDTPILNPATIKEISFMCRSNFGKQQGDFKLEVESLEAVKGSGKDSDGGLARWWRVLRSWWRRTWIAQTWGWYWGRSKGDEGKPLLP